MICYIDLTSFFVIAFLKGNNIIYQKIHENSFQDQIFSQEFHKSLVESEIDSSEITKMIVVSGPGSFTGIRISIAFVQGFCFTNSIPIYLISSLRVISFLFSNLKEDKSFLPANKGFMYVGYFNDKNKFVEVIKNNQNVDQNPTFYSLENLKERYPFKKIVEYVLKMDPVDPSLIKPNYIQIPSVTQPKRKRKL